MKLRIGDRVIIYRRPPYDDPDMQITSWVNPDMDRVVGKQGIIDYIGDHSVRLQGLEGVLTRFQPLDDYWWPKSAIRPIKRKLILFNKGVGK